MGVSQTIDVAPNGSEVVTTAAQLARDLGIAEDSNVHRYIRKLKDNAHPRFPLDSGPGLTDVQVDVIKEYRRLTIAVGLRGDKLIDQINAFPPPSRDERLEKLRAELKAIGLPEALVAKIVEIASKVFL